MSYLSNHSIRASIKEEMQAIDTTLAEMAADMQVSEEELKQMLDPSHDLTLDELDSIMGVLSCDIRYEVVPD